jgi:Zn-dependent peptidase ImmA (M78 family)
MRGQTVTVNPKVIRWARERRLLSEAAAAAAMNVPIETLQAWESGRGMKVSEIQRMAKAYHCPNLLLLQPEVPALPPAPKDFRTVAGLGPALSLTTLLAVDEARRVQMLTSDLASELPDMQKPTIPHHVASDSAEEVGALDRDLFNFTIEDQIRPGTPAHAFERWRTRVQNTGVLVLVEAMNRDECRGFSLHSGGTPTIVIARESPQAMSFTLFHEYAHLTRRQDALCLERDIPPEKWCNGYAGALLVPGSRLRLEVDLRPNEWVTSTKTVQRLATKFKVSRHVMALRLKALRLGTQELYEQIKYEDAQRQKLLDEISAAKEEEEKKKEGGPESHVKRLAEVGVRFTGVVLTALDRGAISVEDASEYLDIAPARLDLLRRDMTKKMETYG